MRRPARSLLLLIASAVTLSPTAVLAAPSPAAACREPRLERVYDHQAFGLRLAVDLSGCGWWDGGPIQLAAELSRLGGAGEEGAGSFTVCGVHPIVEEAGGDTEESWRDATCEVSVALGHPPVEAARYRGEVTYP